MYKLIQLCNQYRVKLVNVRPVVRDKQIYVRKTKNKALEVVRRTALFTSNSDRIVLVGTVLTHW